MGRAAMSRIIIYRKYAAECLALAKKAADPTDQRLFLEMAASWHRRAAMPPKYLEDEEKKPSMSIEERFGAQDRHSAAGSS
jgi:hypothetical protein